MFQKILCHYLCFIPRFAFLQKQKLFVSHRILCMHLSYYSRTWTTPHSAQKSVCHSSSYGDLKLYDSISSVLMKHGFSEGQIKRIITVRPEILDIDKESITSNIVNWFSLKMKESDFFNSLTSCPELLLLHPAYVNVRIKELLTIFTQADILKLWKTCPQVFLEDWDLVSEKMQYLLHLMGAEQKSIVKCEALQYNLDCIKKRHLFLFYAGKFKTPSSKKKQKNPPLDKILHKNVSTYIKLCGLSEEEYVAFCEVFSEIKIEMDDLMNNNDSETSDDDE